MIPDPDTATLEQAAANLQARCHAWVEANPKLAEKLAHEGELLYGPDSRGQAAYFLRMVMLALGYVLTEEDAESCVQDLPEPELSERGKEMATFVQRVIAAGKEPA